MPEASPSVPDVFTVHEIARAAAVPASAVRGLVAGGTVGTIDGRHISLTEAVRAVRLIRAASGARERGLFRPTPQIDQSPARALVASAGLHAAMLGAVLFLTTLTVASKPVQTADPARMVFLATPGPGGGGGGGGLRQPLPPPRAALRGTDALRSAVPPPVVVRRPEPPVRRTPLPVRPQPVTHPVEPPPQVAPPAPMPQVVAPVATGPADAHDTAGTVTDPPRPADSAGAGSGGGAGTGAGTGMGQGDGSGIGAGSGGGTGGGPYRPGSGITPPAVQREVKPDYTDEARRRGVSGDVVLEIIVRKDGTVGDVKVLQGLGAGLNQRAIEAVRQWRFTPARRFGTPVDVVVEVAVEFKLR
ncbi:MAG: periplasmic protein TonB [Acidobacteriota bacterium]|jgi:TonB family protein